MVRKKLFLILGLAAALVIPALAGDYAKCKSSTQDCLNHMSAKLRSSGFVGVELDMNEETGALSIVRIIPGSPAEEFGLRAGDQLYALNGVVISKKNHEALEKAKKDWAPGQEIIYTIKRDGNDKEVVLTLAPMPADVMAKWIGQHMLEHAESAIASAK